MSFFGIQTKSLLLFDSVLCVDFGGVEHGGEFDGEVDDDDDGQRACESELIN